jgi:hypothetical protein
MAPSRLERALVLIGYIFDLDQQLHHVSGLCAQRALGGCHSALSPSLCGV